MTDSAYAMDEHWKLEGLQVTTGMSGIPTATVTMVGPDGVGRFVAATGEGPVDAVYKAIDRLIGVKLNLETYGMQAVTEGIDALATTRVTVTPQAGPNDMVQSTTINSQSGQVQVRRYGGQRYTRADRNRCFRRCPKAVVPRQDAAVA